MGAIADRKMLALAESLHVAVHVQRSPVGNPGLYVGPSYGHRPEIYADPTAQFGPAEITLASILAHELAHHLGPHLGDYQTRQPEHEMYAEGVAAYALGMTEQAEWYLDYWAEAHARMEYPAVRWERIRALVAIVGDHMRAAPVYI